MIALELIMQYEVRIVRCESPISIPTHYVDLNCFYDTVVLYEDIEDKWTDHISLLMCDNQELRINFKMEGNKRKEKSIDRNSQHQ